MKRRPWIPVILLPIAVSALGAEPGIVAHRGVIQEAPENTLPAIERAIALGCALVEIDLRYSADGQVVLMHDATLERTTNGTGAVSAMDLARLRLLDAGIRKGPAFAGTRVPTFREALEAASGRIGLYLDLKEADPEPVIRLVKEFRAGERVYFRPYSHAALKKIVDADPRFRVLLDLEDWIQLTGLPALLRRSFPTAALSSGLQNWTPAVLAEAKALGFTTFVNVLGAHDTPDNLRRAVEMGFDFIQTDRQADLRAIVAALRTDRR